MTCKATRVPGTRIVTGVDGDILEMSNPFASARIALTGGKVLSFIPVGTIQCTLIGRILHTGNNHAFHFAQWFKLHIIAIVNAPAATLVPEE